MIRLFFVALLMIPASLNARTVVLSRKVNPAQLVQELTTAGFDAKYAVSSGATGLLVLGDSEVKDPSAIIAAHIIPPDNTAALAAARTQAIALAKKLKMAPGAMTADERDALLLRLCFLLLSTDQ